MPIGLCHLEVAGSPEADPAYARRVRALAEGPVLQGRVRFLGALSQPHLAQALRQAHVLAVPSSYEGFGIAYLEGMSFGLPAIATHSGGASEIITPGQDGYLVSPGQPEALAQVIDELAADRLLLSRMGLAARQRFLAHPTWEQSAAQIRSFLLTLA